MSGTLVKTLLGCMASTKLRQLALVTSIILCFVTTPQSLSATDIDDPAYKHPEAFTIYLADYATFPEQKLAGGVGNIIGHMTGMFVRYPQKIDVWLENIQHPILEVFATIALGLADRQDEAIVFAKKRTVDITHIASVISYNIGDTLIGDVSKYKVVPIKEWLDLNGTFNNTPQHMPWRQDILWSISIVLEDGTAALRILEVMDSLFEELGIRPNGQPIGSKLKTQEFREKLNKIKLEQGEAAHHTTTMKYIYISTGGWSFSSNLRVPYIAEAFDRFASENPHSLAVKEVRLYHEHQ